ncbi:hypothetical protein [Nannocystis pusilla]|uniref:Uncharacterized protein n=1 Tax=Nannocystis pusilla TaxID=889268 RepID=A0ABS7TM56_9BACT|nr:hypothetical protein [Nannocystis pusilla]MBZ5709299.1 hypothetical protein [Nannocystis pusilla]
MSVRRSLAALPFLSSIVVGCYGDIELQACTYVDDPTGCSDGPGAPTTVGSTSGGTEGGDTEGGGASEGPAPTTSAPGVTTGNASETFGTPETGDPVDDPPWVAEIVCDPEIAKEVGPTLVTYTASADAVEAELLDDGVVIATAPVGEPLVFPVIGAATNNPGSELTVRVRDAGGQTAEASIFQPSVVGPPGGEIWKTIEQNDGQQSMGVGVAQQDGLALSAGVVWDGMQVLGTLRRFDEGGKWFGVPGAWTKAHPTWTGIAPLKPENVGPTALAVDAEGFIVFAATAIMLGEPRMYVVRFSPDGELVWELLHNPGTEARGVGVMPDGTIYVTGGIRTNDAPELWDMATWVYGADKTAHGVDVFRESKALDPANEWSERGRGVAVLKDGRVGVVGTREIWDPITNKLLLRGVVLLYEAHAIRVGEWSSTGNLGLQDALLAVTATDDGLAACGYVQADPNAKTQLVVRWFDDALQEQAPRVETSMGASTCNAVGYAREGRTIVGGSLVETGFGANAWIFAVEDAASPLVEYLKLDGPTQGTDQVAALACDYTCAWTGSLQVGNHFQWITGMFRG